MVLLFNVLITNTAANPHYPPYRGENLRSFTKYDVAKYSLAALASYPWSRAIINVQLDTCIDTEANREDMRKFVEREFAGVDFVFSDKRVEQQAEWIALYDLINDDAVMHHGNHDHIFIDGSTEYLKSIVAIAKRDYGGYWTIPYSHWTEAIRFAKCGDMGLLNQHQTPVAFHQDYKFTDTHAFFRGYFDWGVMIISKELYREWFLTGDWRGHRVTRVDGVVNAHHNAPSLALVRNSIGLGMPVQQVILPYREMFRHFDGDAFIGLTNNIVPSLEIPPGFFERRMRIRYGFDDYDLEAVNINPANPNFYAHDRTGTDWRITLAELPWAWRNRVESVEVCFEVDPQQLVAGRIQSVRNMLHADPRYVPYIDSEVENHIIRLYTEYATYGVNVSNQEVVRERVT